jgi:hypothetical protein
VIESKKEEKGEGNYRKNVANQSGRLEASAQSKRKSKD